MRGPLTAVSIPAGACFQHSICIGWSGGVFCSKLALHELPFHICTCVSQESFCTAPPILKHLFLFCCLTSPCRHLSALQECYRTPQKASRVSSSTCASKSPVNVQLPRGPRNRISLRAPSSTFLSTAIYLRNVSDVMPCQTQHGLQHQTTMTSQFFWCRESANFSSAEGTLLCVKAAVILQCRSGLNSWRITSYLEALAITNYFLGPSAMRHSQHVKYINPACGNAICAVITCTYAVCAIITYV